MSTNSFIGKTNNDGTVTGVYCHWDGDISDNGRILYEHYTTLNKINALIALGDLSSLGPEIGEKVDFNDPGDRLCKQCIAYHRDRGDDLCITKRGDINVLCDYYPYVYIYDTDFSKWYVYDDAKTRMPLSELLKEESD